MLMGKLLGKSRVGHLSLEAIVGYVTTPLRIDTAQHTHLQLRIETIQHDAAPAPLTASLASVFS